MLLLSTDSLRGYGLNRIFELAKQAGYEGIDLMVDFGQFDTFNTEYLKKLIGESGIKVHSVCVPPMTTTKRITECVEMAKEIGAKVVVIQPPKIHEFKMAGWLNKEIPKLREKHFLSIALENAPAGTYLGFIPEHAMSSTKDLKNFKHVALDTARIGEQKKDLMRAYNAFKKYLVHVHLSNVYHGKKYSPPDQGVMPLESFLTKLKQDHYPGAIAIRIHPKYLSAGEDEKLVKKLQEVKEYYDKYYTKIEAIEETETKEEEKND